MSVVTLVQPKLRITTAVQIPGRITALATREPMLLTFVHAGLRGVQGPPGAAVAPIDFSFGDASPAVVWTVPAASEIALVSLDVKTPFDGSGATCRLGTAASPGLLLDSPQVDLTVDATFEVTPRLELAAGEQIYLTIVPGAGPSQGSGQILITAITS